MKSGTGLGKNCPGRNGSSRMPAPAGVNWLYLFVPMLPTGEMKGRYAPCRARISLLAIWTSSARTFSSWFPNRAWWIKPVSIGSLKKSSIVTWDEFSVLAAPLKLSGRLGPGTG